MALRTLVSSLLLFLLTQVSFAQRLRIGAAEYRDKVYASWLGQCAGNIYGLAHEQKYFEQPGPDQFPLGYSGWGAARMKAVNGAFSDDDTDIEYMYLLAMEKHGIEPRYSELAEFWKRHVRRDVWLANRAAVAAMRYGFDPPWTGRKQVNPHWFQIDPQLVNEIWAVTAPGMVRYAAAKTDWAARVMSDDWGVEPAVFYGAMYAAAFFEQDISKLIETGRQALPPGARFARTVDEVIALYRKHPADWKAARQEAIAKYYLAEEPGCRTATNANLNGAFAVLALLYGEGDFQRTLDVSCALGFDADNQAATLSGLLGIVRGTRGIPRELLFPEQGWKEPFNDRYQNVTRADLPDAGMRDIGRRLALVGEQVILRHGGRVDGNYYEIDPEAVFKPPFEFPAGPLPVVEAGRPVQFEFEVVGAGQAARWTLTGELPEGLRFEGGRISGSALKPGVYPLTVEVRSGTETRSRRVELTVRGENLARRAQRILTPVEKPDPRLFGSLYRDTPPAWLAGSAEVLRDGARGGPGATFASISSGGKPPAEYYGYEWAEEQQIGALAVTVGFLEETSGWFGHVAVEYRDPRGTWLPVGKLHSQPAFPETDGYFDKAHFAEYLFSFEPVTTRAIRVGGPAAQASNKPGGFTSLSELSVYRASPRSQIRRGRGIAGSMRKLNSAGSAGARTRIPGDEVPHVRGALDILSRLDRGP
ncbi:MAG: ADP-ribosylglycohydrolase family protein [Acidobacteriota bacterium]